MAHHTHYCLRLIITSKHCQFLTYSRCLKSGHPKFCIFETCPIVKTSGFQTLSEIRTFSSRFQTSSSNDLNKGNQTISNVLSNFQTLKKFNVSDNWTQRPDFRHIGEQVPNQFQHQSLGNDIMSVFQTHFIFKMSENLTKCMVFRHLPPNIGNFRF